MSLYPLRFGVFICSAVLHQARIFRDGLNVNRSIGPLIISDPSIQLLVLSEYSVSIVWLQRFSRRGRCGSQESHAVVHIQGCGFDRNFAEINCPSSPGMATFSSLRVLAEGCFLIAPRFSPSFAPYAFALHSYGVLSKIFCVVLYIIACHCKHDTVSSIDT